MSTGFSSINMVVQRGHAEYVRAISVGPRDRLLLTASRDRTVKLWDLDSGKLIRELPGHGGRIKDAVIDKYGKVAATISWGSNTSYVHVWDLKTGRKLSDSIPTSRATSGETVCFTPDGSCLYGNSDSDVKLLWENPDLRPKENWVDYVDTGHDRDIQTIRMKEIEGKLLLATFSEDGTVKLWNLETGILLQTYEHGYDHDRDKALSLCFTPDGDYLITGGDKTAAKLWSLTNLDVDQTTDSDAVSSHPAYTFEHGVEIRGVAVSSNGNYLATAGTDGAIKLWELNDLEQRNPIAVLAQGYATKLTALQFSHDGKYLLAGDEAGIVNRWDINEQEVTMVYTGESAMVNVAKMSPDKKWLAVGDDDNVVRIWDLALGRLINNLNMPRERGEGVTSLDFSQSDQYLVFGSRDSQVSLWNINEDQTTAVCDGSGDIISVSIGQSDRYIAFADDWKASLVDLESEGSRIEAYQEGGDSYNMRADFNAITGVLVTGGYYKDGNYKIEVWDSKTSQLKHTFFGAQSAPEGHSERIRALKISSDGRYLVSGSDDRSARLWDLEDRSGPIHIFDQHESWVISVDISLGGRYIVTGEENGLGRLWDSRTGEELAVLKGHNGPVAVSITDDARYIITGSQDSTTKIWEFNGESPPVELATLVAIGDDDWVVVTPSGLFDGSSEGLRKMHLVQGFEIIALDQIKKIYYEPGLLGTLITGSKSDLRKVHPIKDLPLFPRIKLAEVQEGVLHVDLEEREGGMGKVWIKVNGKEVVEDANPDRKTNFSFSLDPHKQHFHPATWDNQISITTFNAEGWLRSRPHIIPEYWPTFVSGKAGRRAKAKQQQKESGRDLQLFSILIGTSKYKIKDLSLDYPDSDVTRFGQTLNLIGKQFFKKTDIRQFVSDSPNKDQQLATKANIEKAFLDMSKAARANDVFLIFLSGHGDMFGTGSEAEFYYLTKDLPSKDLASKSTREEGTISTTELTKWIKNIAARKQVMIFDACHSGGFIKGLGKGKSLTATQQRALDEMKDRTGMWVLAGSADGKESFENYALGQGILTYSLLKGIKGAAHRTDDEEPIVDVQVLLSYASNEVPKLARRAGRKQEPVLSVPPDSGGQTFSLGTVLADVAQQIHLPDPKPIFVRSVFLDSNTYHDSIQLSEKLNYRFKQEQHRWFSKQGEPEFVFVDVNNFPDAYKVSGIYSKRGKEYEMIGHLYQGDKVMNHNPFKLKGVSASDLAESLEKEIKIIVKGIKKK